MMKPFTRKNNYSKTFFLHLFPIYFLIVSFQCFSQNEEIKQTLGLFTNTSESYNGYTLINGLNHKTTYLIDNCGRIVHSWSSQGYLTYTATIDKNGDLYRVTNNNTHSMMPGQGRIEKLDWNGNLLWEFSYKDTSVCQHHLICIMPNGNILLIAYEYKSRAEAKQNGRKIIGELPPDVQPEGQVYSDKIIEIKPIGKNQAKIVWEWHAWDHLIQDYDNTKDNYGDVENHPELININYPEITLSDPDWMHSNCVDYNPETEQILLSLRNWSEIWIIDHSTTSKQASGHTGGKYGKGGDLLFRYGNPEAYKNGTKKDQVLFGQHDAHWIPKHLKGGGNILIFNNAVEEDRRRFSNVFELKPLSQADQASNSGIVYLPDWNYKPDPNDSFFSGRMSSTQRMPNGNTLIAEGDKGKIFEIDTNNDIVWKYIVPLKNGEPMTQGEIAFDNKIFNVKRFPKDYPAFNGKDLSPKGYIELNPISYPCEIHENISK